MESWMRYELLDNGVIEMKFACAPRRVSWKNNYLGLFWHEIPAMPTNRWTAHLIGSLEEHKVHGGVSPRAVADLDADSDNDVVTAQGWYENLGRGLKWRFRKNIHLGESHQFG